jgi:polyisoprenoid-binding protein YceI
MTDSFSASTDLAETLRSDAATGVWMVDPGASSAEFAIKHFWGLVTVRGRLERFEGAVEVTATGEVSASLTFEAASVQTGNGPRDRHLRTAHFFDAEQHPAVTFVSRSIVPTVGGQLHVMGALTAAGRDLAVEFDASVSLEEVGKVALEAVLVVDRTAFDMRWNPLGIAASAVTLNLHMTFRQQAGAE